jgi:hypothetical protein
MSRATLGELHRIEEVASPKAAIESCKVLYLRMTSGKTVTIDRAYSLFSSDLGATDQEATMAVAQVQGHPTDKNTLGLVNLVTHTCSVISAKGDSAAISRAMIITWKDGLLIDFGIAVGEAVSA